MMSHRLLLLLLMATPATAQFAQLTASDDGKLLYFTSQMLFHGEQPTLGWPENRLYRFGSDGVTLFAERGALASNSTFSSNSGVTNLSSTGDGSMVGFTFNEICLTGGSSCRSPVTEAELRGKQSTDLGEGNVQISRNGHWALLSNVISDPSNPANRGTFTMTLVDLTTGQRTVVYQTSAAPPFFVPSGGNLLASDGTVLISQTSSGSHPTTSFSLSKQGKSTPVQTPDGSNINLRSISDDGSTLIGTNYTTGPSLQLVTMNVATGQITVVAETRVQYQQLIFLSASNNGQRVLYLATAPSSANGSAFVWDSATNSTIPVRLDAGEQATGGTLSGLGTVAFVATTHARIVTMPVQAGAAASSLFPATPYCDDPGPVGGGSLVALHCSFDLSTGALDGKVWYQGLPMPVIYSKPGELGVQIPWARDNFVRKVVTFDIPSPSGFQPSQVFRAYDAAPVMLPAGAGQSSLFGIQMIKGDWSGLVTSPPQPGDIVYVYMTGLGPVTGDVETGVPASIGSLRPIQWGLTCRFTPQAVDAGVLFAGLAPSLIGVYQVALRVPSDPQSGPPANLQCQLSVGHLAVTFGPGFPTSGLDSFFGGFGGGLGLR